MNTVEKETVVSGIRATGKLHYGQYLGVLTRFAERSKDPKLNCFFFVADLHTLTTLKESVLIKEYLHNIVLDYLAAGVDYENSVMYVQSDVPSVTELAWYLSCITPVAKLLTQPAYKEKAEKQPYNNNVGLLTYPVLMTADILGPRAHYVPVGKDQEAHLELAAQTARKFNQNFGNYFPIPDALREEMVMVPGLSARNPDGAFPKMGKSDNNSINLDDSEDLTLQKIKASPTDPKRVYRADPGIPEDCVIFHLHKLASGPAFVDEIAYDCRTAEIGCVDCKVNLAQNINHGLAKFRERRAELAGRRDLVKEILHEGGRKAEKVFAETLGHVREKMGIDF